MQMGAIEGRARLAILILFVALLAAIGINLAFYLQSTGELEAQKLEQTRLQAALLSSVLAPSPSDISEDQLRSCLNRYEIDAIAELYSADLRPISRASTIGANQPFDLLTPGEQTDAAPRSGRSAGPLRQTRGRIEKGFEIAESPAGDGRILVLGRPTRTASLPALFYVLIYQLLGLVVGVAVAALLLRWLLKPYRRVVEAARHSPVRGSAELSESEFVVETFQALITQLQAKEKELAQLHSMERRRAERSERFSERLIANIPSGLVTINSSGQVTSSNGHASALFGSDEIIADQQGASPLNGKPGPSAIDYRAYFNAAPQLVRFISECLSSGVHFKREEADINDVDGRVRRLGLSISPMTDSSHNVEGALCLLADITEITDLRERMKLQENLANLGEMAAGLAHEFKNSLATIQGYVQLLDLQNKHLPDRENNRSQITQEAASKEVGLLAQLVTDFLNFARPQRLSLDDVALKEIITDCLREIRPELDQHGIQTKIEGDFPNLHGDEAMLRRAFVNLLRNAAEAISSVAPLKLIEISGAVDRSGIRYAHVRIRDTGEGIPSENLQHIFIPFFTTKSRGYGIGLALVQKIVIAHGGSVSVEHSDASGTTFHCRLPLLPISTNRQDLSDTVE